MNSAHAVWQGLLRLVYPSTCWVCGELTDERDPLLCEPCLDALTRDPFPTCPRCCSTVGLYTQLDQGCPACRNEAFAFATALRMAPYEGRLREVILRMKQRAGEELAEVIARVWARTMAPRLTGLGIDVVVPVPLHWQRRLWRGFNGCEVLARQIAHALQVPQLPRGLRWTRRTGEQKGLAPTARRDNVRNALRARLAPTCRGKTVLLVDDVMTTGATAHEAARTLRQGGAARVILAVLAHGR